MLAGSIAGGLASAVCNPTDLIKVRLQTDMAKRGAAKRYTGIVDAFTQIVK